MESADQSKISNKGLTYMREPPKSNPRSSFCHSGIQFLEIDPDAGSTTFPILFLDQQIQGRYRGAMNPFSMHLLNDGVNLDRKYLVLWFVR